MDRRLTTTLAALAAVTALGPQDARAQEAPRPDQQVVLVTGSTSGLGRELAFRLASSGAHVIVHGRNVERGTAVVDSIMAEGAGSAEFHRADLGSLDEVRAFARAVLERHERLDVLINNAGFGSAPTAMWSGRSSCAGVETKPITASRRRPATSSGLPSPISSGAVRPRNLTKRDAKIW